MYRLLYADYEIDDYGFSELIYWALIAFLVGVVLLNLLIALMADSFSRVQERRILAESLEKLQLAIEAILMKRALTGKAKKEMRQLALMRNKEYQDDDEDDDIG